MVNHTQTVFTNSLSGAVLLDKVIDYAGIFPPSQLPLNEAINNYADYMNEGDSWILGPFVFPAHNLSKLDEYMDLFTSEKPLSISAIIRRATNSAEMMTFLEEDLQTIQNFEKKYGGITKVEVLELPLPSLSLCQTDFEQIRALIEKYNVTCYCEIPIGNGFNEEELDKCLELISNTNKLRAKLRTGSVKKELIPNVDVVSTFIYLCKKHQVPMKFTAGLHHPMRMYRDEVKTKMHGFVNVFTAGFMAFYHDLASKQIQDILSDENHRNFSFQKDKLVWNDLEIPIKDIKNLRTKYVCSFGSCNFIGPIKEFIDLNIIEGGI